MSLNPGGASNYNWNYSNQNNDGFSLELWGTVVSMQEVQAREFNPNNRQPGRPRCWPDGNPVMNIRIGFATPDGSLKSITFQKAGKKQVSGEKPSLHMQLFNLTNGNMMELMGKTVHLTTWPAHPQTGQAWGQGNPRLFAVEEVTNIKYELTVPLPSEFLVPELLCNDGAQGGQPIPPSPQQMQQANVMPMQGGYFAAPTITQQYQPQPQPMYQQAPMQQAPVQQQAAIPPQQMPATQAMPPQQASAPMPQGMDPAVAAAMQSIGATNVQPVQSIGQPEGDLGGVYDQDILF